MATTHVFIVDSITFNFHLKYLFAGTGAGSDDIDFNNSDSSNLNYGKEKKLASMTADASRIRRGDKIIFYLQQNIKEGIAEGKFFGVFKAVNNFSFIDRNDRNHYLSRAGLNKTLLFRTLIEPDIIYPNGVTEWEALDAISGMTSPNQMLWSLIYRKLKGNRGNTMITIYESDKLCQLLRNKNNRTGLTNLNRELQFDTTNQQIIISGNNRPRYAGRQTSLNLLPRLLNKYDCKQAFESHLQSYILKNIGTNSNESLDIAVLGERFTIEWLGNEVSCGVGMQRIDIAISASIDGNRVFFPIELKAVEASTGNVRQIKRYIDWIEQYYIPNRQSDIHPIIIAKEIQDKNSLVYSDIVNSFREFNTTNSTRCLPIKYIEFKKHRRSLLFSHINYSE